MIERASRGIAIAVSSFKRTLIRSGSRVSTHEPFARSTDGDRNDVADIDSQSIHLPHCENMTLWVEEVEFHVPAIRLVAADRAWFGLNPVELHGRVEILVDVADIERLSRRKVNRPLVRRNAAVAKLMVGACEEVEQAFLLLLMRLTLGRRCIGSGRGAKRLLDQATRVPVVQTPELGHDDWHREPVEQPHRSIDGAGYRDALDTLLDLLPKVLSQARTALV